MSGTRTATVYTLIAALLKANQFLGSHSNSWVHSNQQQKDFLTKFFTIGNSETQNIPEIEAKADNNSEVLNKFLEERGFDLKFESFGPHEFGVASVMDLLLYWIMPGEETTLTGQRTKEDYPAVSFEDQVQLFEAHDGTTVAKIYTQDEHKQVFIIEVTDPSQVPQDRELLLYAQSKIGNQSKLQIKWGYKGLEMPMINLDVEIELDWLKNLKTYDSTGVEWSISSGKQQTKLRLNERGVRIQDAVAITVAMSVSLSRTYVVDKPFILAVLDDRLNFPLFAGYLEENVWQKPEDIESN